MYLIAQSTEPFTKSLKYIEKLEEAYQNIFSQVFVDTERSPFYPSCNRELSSFICEEGFKHLKSKLSCTVRTFGSQSLVNLFVETACATSSSANSVEMPSDTCSVSTDLGLKSAFRFHILQTEDRISKGSVETRKLIRLLAKHSSSGSLILLEALWREVIVESVLLSCSPPQQLYSQSFTPKCRTPSPVIDDTLLGKTLDMSIGGSVGMGVGVGVVYTGHLVPGSPLSSSAVTTDITLPQIKPSIGPTPEMFASTLVDSLLINLKIARECSRVDLHSLGCSMSADFAFAVAYRRMPKESAVELAKAIAVRISSLLDRQKQSLSQSQSLIESSEGALWCTVNTITDLIRVIFTQTPTEFQHFYEVLLARRLLRTRYFSLERERHMLTLLPALDKGHLMIRCVLLMYLLFLSFLFSHYISFLYLNSIGKFSSSFYLILSYFFYFISSVILSKLDLRWHYSDSIC